MASNQMNSMPDIPDEVIHYNILNRLPRLPLLRFKCVCKDWYTLINSSTFINCQNYDLDFFIVGRDGRLFNRWSPWLYTYLDAPKYINRKDIVFEYEDQREFPSDIIGSSNGLICFCARDPNEGCLMLCNPLTRECSKLIPSRTYDNMKPLYGCSEYAFGYDFVSHDYKILEIFIFFVVSHDYKILGNFTAGARVFSANAGSWKVIKNVPRSPVDVCGNFSAVVNNTLHVVVIKSPCDGSYKLLTFDLHGEKFDEMPFPSKIIKGDRRNVWLRVSSGRLYAVVMDFASVYCESIWVMEEYGIQESWLKLSDLHGSKIVWPIMVNTYGSGGKGRDELLATYEDDNEIEGLAWYKLDDKSNVKVDRPGTRQNYRRLWVCVASLVPIPDNVKSLSKLNDVPGLRN